jgi:membrane-associated phospholipid phosphatase
MARVKAALAARDGLVQIAVVLAAVAAYEALRAMMTPDWPRALQNAREVASLEHMLGIDWESTIQQTFLAVPSVVELFNLFYFVGHFVLSSLFLIWLYRTAREGFRLFRDMFLFATAIAVFVHWAYPTAPPRLAGVGLDDTLLAFWNLDIGSPEFHGWSNPVAAVPSLHAAWAFAVAIGLVRYGGPVLRAAGIVYAPLVLLTIVVTGNHFFLDAAAGLMVLLVGFAAAFLVRPRRSTRSNGGNGAILEPATRGGAVR